MMTRLTAAPHFPQFAAGAATWITVNPPRESYSASPSQLSSIFFDALHYENQKGQEVEPGKGEIYRMTQAALSGLRPNESLVTDGTRLYKITAKSVDTYTVRELSTFGAHKYSLTGFKGGPQDVSASNLRKSFALVPN
jgi:hypothetical protein